MAKLYRFFAGALCAAVVSLMAPACYFQTALPDRYVVTKGQPLSLGDYDGVISCGTEEAAAVAQLEGDGSYKASLKLLGLVPIKEVDIHVSSQEQVALCGVPFGIKMTTQGVLVVGTGTIPTEEGPKNPAALAGVREGDLLLSLGGCDNLSNRLIAQLVQQSQGQPLALCYARDGLRCSTTVTPLRSSADGAYHIGLWVRDSSAGIGTLTFCEVDSGAFGGLGHAICDVDTGKLLPLHQGEVVHASITGLRPGSPGQPGELEGTFSSGEAWGVIDQNCPSGIFGRFYSDWEQFPLVTVAHAQEVRTGPAQLVCTLDDRGPQTYQVEIEKIHNAGQEEGRNLVIHVTDPRLLQRSGGILQGMSGSPLLQNGKLVGAVTHVFVNDPTRGYGIFIDSMLAAA